MLCDAPNSHETIPTIQDMEEYANKTRCDFVVDYSAMQYSLLINNVVEVLGGFLFLLTAVYIIKDKLRCDRYVAGKRKNVLYLLILPLLFRHFDVYSCISILFLKFLL